MVSGSNPMHTQRTTFFAMGAGVATAIAIGLLLSVTTSAAPPAGEKPADVGLRESTTVELVPIEVTVWPKEEGSDACLGLTKEDFELSVDRKPRPIYAVDALGADDETYLAGAAPRSESDSVSHGMTLVLLFDLWHLNIFTPAYDCPITKPLAFDEARRMVREQFHDGDRLLLVTSAGWPTVHYGWLRTPAAALRALDRLEKNRQVLAPRQEHLHHNGWIQGMESLFLALGRYPGRKDVIYLADDFRFDDVAMRMYEIAARAQANGVVVSAVDLLQSCRRVSGPGLDHCPPPSLPSGGLGCTEFSVPIALTPLSRDTGGTLFRNPRIDLAVRELRAMRKCRYLVTFKKEPQERRRAPEVKLELRGGNKGVTLLAPSSFETPEHAPSPRQNDEALFLLPRFGRGIAAEVALWPYLPVKRGRWKSFVMARVERTDDEPWPDELTELDVHVLVHKQSSVYGNFGVKITGDELNAFRKNGRTEAMFFPVDKVPPGDVSAEVTVIGNAEDISANVRTSFLVPKPPAAGEARPWFFSDHVARRGQDVLFVPSLDATLSPGELGTILAYGCRKKNDTAKPFVGRLSPLDESAVSPVSVPVVWLAGADAVGEGCGWLAGTIPATIQPGLWSFAVPESLIGGAAPDAVEFTVLPPEDSSKPPAEIRLN